VVATGVNVMTTARRAVGERNGIAVGCVPEVKFLKIQLKIELFVGVGKSVEVTGTRVAMGDGVIMAVGKPAGSTGGGVSVMN